MRANPLVIPYHAASYPIEYVEKDFHGTASASYGTIPSSRTAGGTIAANHPWGLCRITTRFLRHPKCPFPIEQNFLLGYGPCGCSFLQICLLPETSQGSHHSRTLLVP